MDNNLIFRKTAVEDFPLISKMLAVAKLPVDGAAEHLDNFILLQMDDELIGAIGLEVYGGSGLLRSFVIKDEYRNQGLGQKLYEELIKKALEQEISKIYLLTETAEKFFAKQGFKKIDRNIADEPVKNSVEFKSACPQSAVCMLLELSTPKIAV